MKGGSRIGQHVQVTKHLETTNALTKALHSKCIYTYEHSENVSAYAVEVAKNMKLSKKQCHAIRTGAMLHDIGKIGLSEHILKKAGTLTDGEYNEIKKHPLIGYEMIKNITEFRENGVANIVLYHHERYDGKGYPFGLKGEEIPLEARIIAITDAFDAMTTNRVYQKEVDLHFALNEIKKNKGKQFDPEIAELFLSLFVDNKLK